MKSGVVTIVGRPNVGKSTLLNSLVEAHVAITSNKVGTTRNIIEGIYTDDDSQIVFVDTPGINKALDKLGNVLNKKSYNAVDGVDLVLFLIDAKTGIGKGDKVILDRLKEDNVNTFLIINKIDSVKKHEVMDLILKVKDVYDFKEIIPVSSLTGDNVNTLIDVIKDYMKDGEKIFDDEVITNVTPTFYVSEIVREKVLNLTDKEVPHAVTCVVEKLVNESDKVIITVLIIVDRDSLKKIIIGHGGSKIKEIGMLARRDLEEYFGKKVYLETFVKTIENWRQRESSLKDLGIDELNN